MSANPILEPDGEGKSYLAHSIAWGRFAGWLSGTPPHFVHKLLPGETVVLVWRASTEMVDVP